MTNFPDDFSALLQRVRDGDQQATAELVSKYEPEVKMVARVRLGAPLRPYMDSVDLVQSVHRSLLIGLRADKFDISSPDRLVALAVTIVRRKVARQWRRMQRQNRLSGAYRDESAGNLPDMLVALSSSSSDPAQHAHLKERLNQVLTRLEDLDRELIGLRLQGHTTAEAARELGVDPDSLRVRLSRLRKRIREAGLADDLI